VTSGDDKHGGSEFAFLSGLKSSTLDLRSLQLSSQGSYLQG